MNNFTQAYKKCRKIIQAGNYSTDGWQKAIDDSAISGMLSKTGFDIRHNSAADKIRNKVTDETSCLFSRVFLGGNSRGEVIYNAAENTAAASTHKDRAATLKMITHLYRHSKTGGQDIWIYSPPKKHTKWIFDEVTGDVSTIKSKLNDSEELFSNSDKDHMSAALHMALKVSESTKVELGKRDDNVKKLVKRWFLDDSCGETELNAALDKLIAGFNKVASTCGSNSLVFTDYPDWSSKRSKYMGAATPGGEGGGFPVIYIEGAFNSYVGNSGMLWTCARTIIHEFTHHDLNTKDHQYRHTGLKPKSGFPYSKAIENADSWACFAIDLTGYLSVADRTKFLV